MAGQAAANQQLWKHLTQALAAQQRSTETPNEANTSVVAMAPVIRVQKMTKDDAPKAWLEQAAGSG